MQLTSFLLSFFWKINYISLVLSKLSNSDLTLYKHNIIYTLGSAVNFCKIPRFLFQKAINPVSLTLEVLCCLLCGLEAISVQFSKPLLHWFDLTHARVDQRLVRNLWGCFIHRIRDSPYLLLSFYHHFSAYRGSLSWFLWPKGWHDFCQHFTSGRAWLPDGDLFLKRDLEKN